MELGHAAIFGDSGASGSLRDPETEQEIYDYILKQQMEAVGVEDEEDSVEVGLLQVINYYTGNVVTEAEIWLLDEAHRHEHFDHNVERRGKFLSLYVFRDA